MDRINFLLNNELFKNCLSSIAESEMNRKFCRHDLKHFLDVARIAYILNLERNYNIDKDIIYAAALLHDIGRCAQYKEGVPHEKASLKISDIILHNCNYKDNEISLIFGAIAAHRTPAVEKSRLSEILYESDKISRECFHCDSVKECKWPDDKLNLQLKY